MLRKTIHFGLSILLLIATMGMNINLHYCQHKLYDIGVFSKAKSCCPENDVNSKSTEVHSCCKAKAHPKNECEDKTMHIDPVDNFIVTTLNFNFTNNSLINLFFSSTIGSELFILPLKIVSKHFNWDVSPPNIHVSLSLLQTYLL